MSLRSYVVTAQELGNGWALAQPVRIVQSKNPFTDVEQCASTPERGEAISATYESKAPKGEFQEVIARIGNAAQVLNLVKQAFASGCLQQAERQIFTANGGVNASFVYSPALKVGTLDQLSLKTPFGTAFMYQYYFQTGELFAMVSDLTAGRFDLKPVREAAAQLS